MRQLDQRVSIRYELEPLDRDGVGATSRTGCSRRRHGDRVSFATRAVDLIADDGGIPRLINLICDRALHRGHLARTSLIARTSFAWR